VVSPHRRAARALIYVNQPVSQTQYISAEFGDVMSRVGP
jgi:hypothetical protein